MILSTDQKGAIAETPIARKAIKLGIGVYRPVMEGGRYDLILAGGKLLRVQCKWATLAENTVLIRYSCRRSRSGMVVKKYTGRGGRDRCLLLGARRLLFPADRACLAAPNHPA
jgi:hypothetical protein